MTETDWSKGLWIWASPGLYVYLPEQPSLPEYLHCLTKLLLSIAGCTLVSLEDITGDEAARINCRNGSSHPALDCPPQHHLHLLRHSTESHPAKLLGWCDVQPAAGCPTSGWRCLWWRASWPHRTHFWTTSPHALMAPVSTVNTHTELLKTCHKHRSALKLLSTKEITPFPNFSVKFSVIHLFWDLSSKYCLSFLRLPFYQAPFKSSLSRFPINYKSCSYC